DDRWIRGHEEIREVLGCPLFGFSGRRPAPGQAQHSRPDGGANPPVVTCRSAVARWIVAPCRGAHLHSGGEGVARKRCATSPNSGRRSLACSITSVRTPTH